MPTVVLSGIYTGTPPSLQSYALSTAGGAECVDLGTPIPTTITVTQTVAPVNISYSFNWRDAGCNIVQFEPQFSVPFNTPVVRAVPTIARSFGMFVHNIERNASITASWVGGPPPPTGNCQFGTRKKGTVDSSVYVTADLVAAILTAVGVPQAAAAFLVSFYGTAFVVDDLCSRLPPTPPTLDLGTFLNSAETLNRLFSYIAWTYFCECVPGSPTPIPVPPPTIVIPPGTPVRPTATCDPLDMCSALVRILNDLGVLTTVVNQMYGFVTIMQRNGLPFSYVRGLSHEQLTGSGALAIDRLVGLQAVVTSRPPGLQEFTGAPIYISDLGWISALTPDGLLDEIRLTREVQSWFSKLLPTATQIGWGLREGVEITLTELLPEP